MIKWHVSKLGFQKIRIPNIVVYYHKSNEIRFKKWRKQNNTRNQKDFTNKIIIKNDLTCPITTFLTNCTHKISLFWWLKEYKWYGLRVESLPRSIFIQWRLSYQTLRVVFIVKTWYSIYKVFMIMIGFVNRKEHMWELLMGELKWKMEDFLTDLYTVSQTFCARLLHNSRYAIFVGKQLV